MNVSKNYLSIVLLAKDILEDNPLSDFWLERYYLIEDMFKDQEGDLTKFYKETLRKMAGIKADKWKHLRLRAEFPDFVKNVNVNCELLDKWESQIKKFIKEKTISPAANWFTGAISNTDLLNLELCG